jgi:taurine transport system substrate-binding protein
MKGFARLLARGRAVRILYAVLLGVLICSSAMAESLPPEIRLAWAGAPRIWVLGKIDQSFDKELGLPVKWVQFSSGADVLSLFAAGEIDIARFGSSPLVAAFVQGLPVELIGVPEVVVTSEQLVVSESIKDVKGLEGKTIAVPSNSTPQYAFEVLLDKGVVDKNKVKVVTLKPAETLAAYKRGDIDGAYSFDPVKAELIASGAHVIFSTGDLRKDGVLVFNNLAVSKKFAEAYPGLVSKFLKTYEGKVEQYKKDPESAANAIANHLGQSTDTVRETLKGMEYPSIAEQLTSAYFGSSGSDESLISKAQMDTAAFLVKIGQLQKNKVPKSFAGFNNPSFLEEAQKLK